MVKKKSCAKYTLKKINSPFQKNLSHICFITHFLEAANQHQLHTEFDQDYYIIVQAVSSTMFSVYMTDATRNLNN